MLIYYGKDYLPKFLTDEYKLSKHPFFINPIKYRS